MKKKKTMRRKKSLLPFKIISTLLLIISVIFIILLSYSDLLPIKYFGIIVLIILVFDIFNILVLNIRRLKRNIKKTICIIVFFAMIILSIGSSYLYKTTSVLKGNGDSKYKVENYSIIVLKNSTYESLKDIKGNIGYYENSINSSKAINTLNKTKKFNYDSYKSSDTLVDDLLKNKISAILLEDSIKKLFNEEIEGFESSTKVIYSFKIKVSSETNLKDANVTKEPFAVYISGIDTYGEIASVSRSDVNIVAIINPKIRQVLLVSIPRDYYVKLHGTTGYKDKLTHAGIYGINMSIGTIEDLLDIDINYYVKVNFTSVIDIVDSLGGLDVYSEYSFTSYSGYYFKKGMNTVNGEQALDFARTRKAFSNGDRQRGINQQAIIEAAVRKATSKTILTKYVALLNSVDGKYQTNMSYKKITSLIKMQLNDMSPWTITSYSLTGKDSSNYTYTYNQLLYVMEPDNDSVVEAKSLINKVFKNESLDSSYNDISSNSYKVSETKSNVSSSEFYKPNEIENSNNDTVQEENLEIDTNDNEEEILEPITPKPEENQAELEDNGDIIDVTDTEDPIEDLTPDENQENNE